MRRVKRVFQGLHEEATYEREDIGRGVLGHIGLSHSKLEYGYMRAKML